MIATRENNGESRRVRNEASSPTTLPSSAVSVQERNHAIYRAMINALSTPGFFDFPDGKQFICLLEAAFQEGFEFRARPTGGPETSSASQPKTGRGRRATKRRS